MRKLMFLLVFVMCIGLFGCKPENDVNITENVGQFEDNNLYQVSIDGVVYSFPMLYSEFEEMGWTYEYGMSETIESGDWEYGHLWTNGEIRIQSTMANLSESEKHYSECMIAGIYFDDYYGYDAEDEIVVPGGIQIGVSTRKDILAAYGEPSSEVDREENYRLDYRHDHYSKIYFFVDNESGILTEIDVENCIPMAGTQHCYEIVGFDREVPGTENITESEENSDAVVSGENASEDISDPISGEELVIYVCKEDIIDERTALDKAYAFYYDGSDMEQYSVFCEELPLLDPEKCEDVQNLFGYSYADSPKMGYVVAQYSSQTNTEMEKYDPTNEVLDKNMTMLMPLGLSANGAFYQFWLCQYIYDGDGRYHFTTLDYIAVSLDGKTIVAERTDMNGNYIEDLDKWDAYYDYLDCDAEILDAQSVSLKEQELLSKVTYPWFDKSLGYQLFMLRRGQDSAGDFTGTWNRTNVVSGFRGSIEITNQDASGFDFEGDVMYYSHSGMIEGRAYFVGSNVAVYQVPGESWEPGCRMTDCEYILFEYTEAGIKVYATSGSAALGFGMNCTIDGEYIKGEPLYTNATVMEDNFTADEQEEIRSILGDERYKDYFEFVIEEGVFSKQECTLKDGIKALYYDGFVPTMGGYYRFIMLKCENGDIYLIVGNQDKLFSNVEGATKMPEFEIDK